MPQKAKLNLQSLRVRSFITTLAPRFQAEVKAADGRRDVIDPGDDHDYSLDRGDCGSWEVFCTMTPSMQVCF